MISYLVHLLPANVQVRAKYEFEFEFEYMYIWAQWPVKERVNLLVHELS